MTTFGWQQRVVNGLFEEMRFQKDRIFSISDKPKRIKISKISGTINLSISIGDLPLKHSLGVEPFMVPTSMIWRSLNVKCVLLFDDINMSPFSRQP